MKNIFTKTILFIAISVVILVGTNCKSQNRAVRTGVISLNKDTLIPFAYWNISKLGNHYFFVTNHDKQIGVCNKSGEEIIPCSNDYKSFIALDCLIIGNKNDNYNCIFNSNGEIVIPCENRKIKLFKKFVEITINSNSELYDYSLQHVCPYIVENVQELFDGSIVALANIDKEKKIIVIDTSGKEIARINPGTFSVNRKGTFFTVLIDSKYAIFDSKGIQKTPFELDDISELKSNYYTYFKNNTSYVIDLNLKELLSIKEHKIIDLLEKKEIYYIIKNANGKLGCANSKGEIILPVKYNKSKTLPIPLGNNFFMYAGYDDNVLIYNGKIVFEEKQSKYFPIGNVVVVQKKDGTVLKYYLINSKKFKRISDEKYKWEVINNKYILLGDELYDFDGKLILEYVHGMYEDIIVFKIKKKNNILYGLKKITGEIVCEAKYAYIQEFSPGSNGMAGATTTDSKNVYINKAGKEVSWAEVKAEVYNEKKIKSKDSSSITNSSENPIALKDYYIKTYKNGAYVIKKNSEVHECRIVDENGKEILKGYFLNIKIENDCYILSKVVIDPPATKTKKATKKTDPNTSNSYCYTAICQKKRSGLGTVTYNQAAIFVQITVNGSYTESQIKNFGKSKASEVLGDYQIVKEMLDSQYDCKKCKETAFKTMQFDDFQILYNTMK